MQNYIVFGIDQKIFLDCLLFKKEEKHNRMNEITNRLLVALFCIIYTLLLNYYNIYTTVLYYTSMTVICLFEYHYSINSTKKKITIVLSLIMYLLCIGCVIDSIELKYLTLGLPIIMILFSIELFFGIDNPMLSIGTDLIGIVWIGIPMLLCILISYPKEISGGDRYHDPRIVYGIMTFVFVSDAGAYFGGKVLGKTPLFPSISPKKTWEGAISGATVSMLMYPVVCNIELLNKYQWFVVMMMSIIFGIIGDLIESMFKRDLKIKDSGTILQNHGGCLDRIDSLLYCVPFIYTYLVLINKI